MKVDSFPPLSREEIAHARLQYYGPAAVMAAWEQMVAKGLAAELEASDARRVARLRRENQSNGSQNRASPPHERGMARIRNATGRSLFPAPPPQARMTAVQDRYGRQLFDEAKHPRVSAGSPEGGQFTSARGAVIPGELKNPKGPARQESGACQ